MIAAILKSAIILASAALIVSFLRRQSAALRHTVWTAGLAGALAIPFFSVALPEWPNRVVGQATSYADRVLETSVLPYVLPASQSGAAPGEALESWTTRDIAIAVWIFGAAIGFLLMICGAARLAWVAVRAEPVQDSRWQTLADETGQALGLRRRVHLLQNRSVRFLGTWGISSPRILLPSDADTWSEERIRLVLAHEMAHIQRRDWPVQVLAEAARAIYWFNPLFWIACRNLRQESEHACDDTVVRLGALGTRYAEELLDLTRSLRNSPSARSPMLAMAQPSHLERRLVALLNPTLNRLAATPWAVLVVAAAAVLLTLPLAAVRSETSEETPQAAAVAAPVTSHPTAVPEDVSSAEAPVTAVPGLVSRAEKSTGKTRALNADTKTSEIALKPAVIEPEPVAATRATCRLTPITRRKQINLEKTAALGSGPWHINDDQSIWAWDQPYTAGREINSMWIRPSEVDLTIRARRTDTNQAFETTIPSKYSTNYVSATLTFPSAGCWEVTGVAGNSALTYVTWVEAQ
jgi:beta-lactamase regulating signal transducer with metallopeptidase domain